MIETSFHLSHEPIAFDGLSYSGGAGANVLTIKVGDHRVEFFMDSLECFQQLIELGFNLITEARKHEVQRIADEVERKAETEETPTPESAETLVES